MVSRERPPVRVCAAPYRLNTAVFNGVNKPEHQTLVTTQRKIVADLTRWVSTP